MKTRDETEEILNTLIASCKRMVLADVGAANHGCPSDWEKAEKAEEEFDLLLEETITALCGPIACMHNAWKTDDKGLLRCGFCGDVHPQHRPPEPEPT